MSNDLLAIVGGVYREICREPEWDHVYGSAGRAAAAACSHVNTVELHTFVDSETQAPYRQIASNYGISWKPRTTSIVPTFYYTHCLSRPEITPYGITQKECIELESDCVLRFGMLEGDAKVSAERCVYDPQSAFNPLPFEHNGSKASHLAVCGNEFEIHTLGGAANLEDSVRALLDDGTDVVIVKRGSQGLEIFTKDRHSCVSAYLTNSVWTIGTGDVFAAIFAARWAVHQENPVEAADVASRAVASYSATRSLPSPLPDTLREQYSTPVRPTSKTVYLAGPFFTIGQRWLIDQAYWGLMEVGLCVKSPSHSVGHGPALKVAKADLELLKYSDIVFAILDDLDPGTLVEVGYAISRDMPVFALAQNVSDENLKMIHGTGTHIFDDLVTAIFHAAWGQ